MNKDRKNRLKEQMQEKTLNKSDNNLLLQPEMDLLHKFDLCEQLLFCNLFVHLLFCFIYFLFLFDKIIHETTNGGNE